MDTEIDVSVLNSVNIKRFTRSVLEATNADVDYSDSSTWVVTFPDPHCLVKV